ncbi:hypothetical protein [Burkholderia sp. ABCPW 11]|uniref:hypothetical protein n=1 Tax=Burkholderia sp. ABCPW 11 TaxID=1637859 RepID=UPI00211D1DCF|nr:hypothetical protein [Burkholderia sp. ABCPW 11]
MIEFARHVIGYMQSAFPGWREVYVCFSAPGDGRYGARASYATAAGVELVSTMEHRDFIGGIMRIGPQLRDALANDGRTFRAALFRANARFSYRMDYDWNDAARWNIRSSAAHPGSRTGWSRWTDGGGGLRAHRRRMQNRVNTLTNGRRYGRDRRAN